MAPILIQTQTARGFGKIRTSCCRWVWRSGWLRRRGRCSPHAAWRGEIQPRQAVLGVRARGTKGLVPHAAMRSPASEQAALTYTVKLIQEGPTLLKCTRPPQIRHPPRGTRRKGDVAVPEISGIPKIRKEEMLNVAEMTNTRRKAVNIKNYDFFF